jgi:hypothetical protein
LITGLIFGAFHLLSVGLGARGLSFFLFIMVLNVFLVLSRLLTQSLWVAIGFHTAFDWVAINVGLGTVVLAERPMLQLERTVSLIAEDLLSMVVVGLGILLFMGWAWRSKRQFAWRATLMNHLIRREAIKATFIDPALRSLSRWVACKSTPPGVSANPDSLSGLTR